MNLSPGGTGTVVFNVALGHIQSDIGDFEIVILRNEIVTTVPVTIDESVTGRYVGTFTVPVNWVEYDKVTAIGTLSWQINSLRGTTECSKYVGVVTVTPVTTEFIADLLVADQRKEGDFIRYYTAGSNFTELLHEQQIQGDPCEGDVTLTSDFN